MSTAEERLAEVTLKEYCQRTGKTIIKGPYTTQNHSVGYWRAKVGLPQGGTAHVWSYRGFAEVRWRWTDQSDAIRSARGKAARQARTKARMARLGKMLQERLDQLKEVE